MTLPASGTLSLQAINAEFGRGLNLNAYRGTTWYTDAGGSGTFSSGAIAFSEFYSKRLTSPSFNFTISANTTNGNLRTLAIAAGWDQSQKVVCTINAGIYCSSNSTATAGFVINGSFPGGVTLINNGYIIGRGGNGGSGGGGYGSAGGLALSVAVAVTIANASGIIGGGGGGGGGGYTATSGSPGPESDGYAGGGGGGGGGRSGITASSGGAGATVSAPWYGSSGSAGGSGTTAGAGSGGSGGNGGVAGTGSTGGAGGNWGAAGSSTAGVTGSAGAAGAAVSGNSYITWSSTGYRYGAIA